MHGRSRAQAKSDTKPLARHRRSITSQPDHPAHATLFGVQRTAGNRAVARAMRSVESDSPAPALGPVLPPRLTSSKPRRGVDAIQRTLPALESVADGDKKYAKLQDRVAGYNFMHDKAEDPLVLLHSLDSVEDAIWDWYQSQEIRSGAYYDRKDGHLEALDRAVNDERRGLVTNPFVVEKREVLAGPQGVLRAGKQWELSVREDEWRDASDVLRDNQTFDVTVISEDGGQWLFTFDLGGVEHKGRAPKSEIDFDVTYSPQQGGLYPEGKPVPEDVLQSNLGDCYLQAGLASLAYQRPDHIMYKMIYDAGAEVVVKLFKLPEFSPKVVKVDKSVPQQQGQDVYNRGALWVRMVQKAYAASGLGAGLLRPTTISYKDIAGGMPAYAMGVLMGKEVRSLTAIGSSGQEALENKAQVPWGFEVGTYAHYREYDQSAAWLFPSEQDREYWSAHGLLKSIFGNNQRLMDGWAAYADDHRDALSSIESLPEFEEHFNDNDLPATTADPMLRWLGDQNLFRGAVGSGVYSSGQIEMVDAIGGALEQRKVVTAGVPKNKHPLGGEGARGAFGEPKYRGLAFGHAYSVVGVRRNATANPESEDAGPHTFLRIRNPWGRYGRRYDINNDEWVATAVEEDGGYSWIELNDFSTNFGDVEIV